MRERADPRPTSLDAGSFGASSPVDAYGAVPSISAA
jgi:hypothetical protein